MLMIIAFHPEMMCVAKVISFRSEMEQAQKEEEARKAEEVACAQQNPEEKEKKTPNPDITQSTPEAS